MWPRSNNVFSWGLLGVLCVSLSGCLVPAMIAGLPDKAKLDPQPDRYLRLTLDVALNNRPRTIEHIWKCTHEKIFSAAVGWTLAWRSEHRKYVVKRADDDLVVFFQQPTDAYCGVIERVPYASDVGVIPDPDQHIVDHVIVHHYRKQLPRSSAILGGSVERLSDRATIPRQSSQERRLEASLVRWEEKLVASVVAIVPDSIWSRYPKLDSYFGAMTKLTVAPQSPPGPRRQFGFPIQIFAVLSTEDVRKRLYYSVREIDGRIIFDPSRTPEHWKVFRFDDRDFQGSTSFCYFERCIPLVGVYNEIYDPETRAIISVSRKLTLAGSFY